METPHQVLAFVQQERDYARAFGMVVESLSFPEVPGEAVSVLVSAPAAPDA